MPLFPGITILIASKSLQKLDPGPLQESSMVQASFLSSYLSHSAGTSSQPLQDDGFVTSSLESDIPSFPANCVKLAEEWSNTLRCKDWPEDRTLSRMRGAAALASSTRFSSFLKCSFSVTNRVRYNVGL